MEITPATDKNIKKIHIFLSNVAVAITDDPIKTFVKRKRVFFSRKVSKHFFFSIANCFLYIGLLQCKKC